MFFMKGKYALFSQKKFFVYFGYDFLREEKESCSSNIFSFLFFAENAFLHVCCRTFDDMETYPCILDNVCRSSVSRRYISCMYSDCVHVAESVRK